VLNDIIAPGESAFISFRCEGADPDGGPVEFSIDFGDGDIRSGLAPEIGPWLDVDKEYMTPGTYLVTLTVEDDEGRSSGATTQIFLGDSLSDGSEALGASIAPDWLLAARQDSVYFTLDEGTGPVTSLASVLWDFGDGNTSANADPAHRYAQAGRYAVSCTAIDDSGNSALTLCSIYIYDPDTNAVRSPGAASRIAAAPQGQRTAVVDAPVHVTRRIVYRGFQHLRVDSNAVITTRNGRPGIPGISGGSGSGLSTYSPGWLIVNGARISAGSGGAGASKVPAAAARAHQTPPTARAAPKAVREEVLSCGAGTSGSVAARRWLPVTAVTAVTCRSACRHRAPRARSQNGVETPADASASRARTPSTSADRSRFIPATVDAAATPRPPVVRDRAAARRARMAARHSHEPVPAARRINEPRFAAMSVAWEMSR